MSRASTRCPASALFRALTNAFEHIGGGPPLGAASIGVVPSRSAMLLALAAVIC
jgi:hypothetical protein